MQLSRIDGALIEGNSVEMERGAAGKLHRDMIQFWNSDEGRHVPRHRHPGQHPRGLQRRDPRHLHGERDRQGDGRPRRFLPEHHDREQHGQERAGLRHRGRRGRGGEDQQQHRAAALGHRQLQGRRHSRDPGRQGCEVGLDHRQHDPQDAGGRRVPQQLAARRLQAVGLDDREQQDRAPRRHGGSTAARRRQPWRPRRRRSGTAATARPTSSATTAANIDGAERVIFSNVDFSEGDRIMLQELRYGHLLSTTPATTGAGPTRRRPTPGSTP